MSLPFKTNFKPEWFSIFEHEFQKLYFKNLIAKVEHAYEQSTVFPAKEQIFEAFHFFEPDDTKVVFLGQDPYHGPNQAMGLSFSVPKEQALPPSLKNIYKELEQDLGIKNTCGSLNHWAEQGVLLLNTSLTVEQGKAGSHGGWGWELFTDKVLELLAMRNEYMVFILLGKPAQAKAKWAVKYGHGLVQAPHPSPLSAHRGFFGSKIFSQTNHLLKERGLTPIDWRT